MNFAASVNKRNSIFHEENRRFVSKIIIEKRRNGSTFSISCFAELPGLVAPEKKKGGRREERDGGRWCGGR